MQETNKKRGRPRKEPLSIIEKWGIKILMGCLQQKLNEIPIIVGGLKSFKHIASFNEIVNEHIIKTLSENPAKSINKGEITLGGWDFWKNLINIYNDQEDVDRPKASYLDILVRFTFNGNTWDDFIGKISNLISFSDWDIDLNIGWYCAVENITPDKLNVGQIFPLGWFPIHFFMFEYLGKSEFKVLYAPAGHHLVPESTFTASGFKVDFNWRESKRIIDGIEILCKTPQYAPPTISPIYIIENL